MGHRLGFEDPCSIWNSFRALETFWVLIKNAYFQNGLSNLTWLCKKKVVNLTVVFFKFVVRIPKGSWNFSCGVVTTYKNGKKKLKPSVLEQHQEKGDIWYTLQVPGNYILVIILVLLSQVVSSCAKISFISVRLFCNLFCSEGFPKPLGLKTLCGYNQNAASDMF